MRRRKVTSRCTRQCAFSASPAKPYCSVSSAASLMPFMSYEERKKVCGSSQYPLNPCCLTSLHKLGGSMKQLPSSPRDRRRRRPGDRGTAAPPPLRLLAGRCAQRGRRKVPTEDRL